MIHEDRGGNLHGNTLTREETEAWLDMEAPGFAIGPVLCHARELRRAQQGPK